MKWGIVILLVLGIVAAACAALLMGALSVRSSASDQKESDMIEVAMAKASLPAMTVMTLSNIDKEMISKDDLPEGQLASPARIIGRVLSVPVVEGQVLTESCFVSEGTGALLAAALPHGMRAVTVSVSSKSMPDRILLYPGCVVDVLVAYRLTSRASEGQALSTTMLRGIQVLAVSGDSVISNPDNPEEGGNKKRNTRSGTRVTLLVDPKQAEALHLAVENGNISLSLRNPLDRKLFELEGTVLSQGRLAHLGSMLTPTVPHTQEYSETESISGGNPQEQTITSNNPQAPAAADSIFSENVPVQKPLRRSPRWGVTVIRGQKTKIEELDVSLNPTDETAPKK